MDKHVTRTRTTMTTARILIRITIRTTMITQAILLKLLLGCVALWLAVPSKKIAVTRMATMGTTTIQAHCSKHSPWDTDPMSSVVRRGPHAWHSPESVDRYAPLT